MTQILERGHYFLAMQLAIESSQAENKLRFACRCTDCLPSRRNKAAYPQTQLLCHH